MKRIIIFESLKFWRAKKNLVVFLVFLISLACMVAFNTAQDKTYWNKQVDSIDLEIVQIKMLINETEAELDHVKNSTPDDLEAIDQVNKYLDFLNGQRLFNLRQRIHAQQNSHDKEERLALWIERDQHLLRGLEKGYTFLDEHIAQVQQRISVNQYLQENKIEPLNSPYEMTAANFVYHLTGYPWILFILIALALLNIDMFSGDMDGGAYKSLYSQPYRRSKILVGKFLVHFVNSFTVVTGLVVVAFGIVALLNGMGDTTYPTFYYTASYLNMTVPAADAAIGTLSFLPWSNYILRTLPLYLLLCTFFIATTGTASLLLRNTANVFSNLICLLFLDFSIRTLFPVDSRVRMLWPLTAAGLNSVMQGIYSLSASAYLLLLGTLTLAIFAISVLVLNKRDLVGGAD